DLVTRHADTIAAVIGDICHVRCRIHAVTPEEPAPAAPARSPSGVAAGGRRETAATPGASEAKEPERTASAQAARAAAPNGGQRELIHEVVDLFQGKIVDE